MSLKEIFRNRVELQIFDFLAENLGLSYNQSEINKQTGISRSILSRKLPEMVERHILAVDGEVGRYKTYRLADNEIVNNLIAAVYAYNAIISEHLENEVKETLEEAKRESTTVEMENRYYVSPKIIMEPQCMKASMLQIEEQYEKSDQTYRIGKLSEKPADIAQSA